MTASYAGDAKNGRAVLYIGDGRSMANLLGSAPFAKLVDTLVSNRIPVNSYILGERVDVQLPGALAMNTGGNLLVNQEDAPLADVGRKLAAITDAAVLWPAAVKFSAEVSEAFPKQAPPLRSDRDTVWIGTLKGNGPVRVEISIEGSKGPQNLVWAVPPRPSDDSNNYLARLVEHAADRRRSELAPGGFVVPGLRAAGNERRDAEHESARAAGAGRRQPRCRREDGRRGVAQRSERSRSAGHQTRLGEARQRSGQGRPSRSRRGDRSRPSDSAAGRGSTASLAGRHCSGPHAPAPPPVGNAPAPGAAGDLNLVGPAPTAPQPPPEGSLLEGVLHDKRVMSQLMQTEVMNALSKARSQMGSNPEAASEELKLTLEQVRKAPDLDPGVREQFTDQLEVALREAARRKLEVEQIRQQQLESAAAGRERMLLTENLLLNQEKMSQLLKRFDSLMDERRYRLAEDSAAGAALKLAEENRVSPTAVPGQAVQLAQAVGNYQFMMDIRAERVKEVLETLVQVEKSFVPFPDEPPIVYPDAELWQELTIRRKAK